MKGIGVGCSMGVVMLLIAAAACEASAGVAGIAASAHASTRIDLFDPARPSGRGRAIDQRSTVTENCQSFFRINGVPHTADIEYHYAWRKRLDSQGRVIEDAEPEWTLVGYTVKELMPLAASVC